jgi:hypothetical protein
MPMPDVPGKRIFEYCFGKACLNSSWNFLLSGVPASNSMPA